MSDEDRENKIVNLFGGATPKPPGVQNRDGVVITGSVSGDVHINVNAPKRRARKVVAAPPGSIDSAQIYEIKTKVSYIARTTGQTPASVWAKFHRKFHVASYRDLPAERFEEAYEFLRQWAGAAKSGRA